MMFVPIRLFFFINASLPMRPLNKYKPCVKSQHNEHDLEGPGSHPNSPTSSADDIGHIIYLL